MRLVLLRLMVVLMRLNKKNIEMRAIILADELSKLKISISKIEALDIVSKLEGFKSFDLLKDKIILEASWRNKKQY